jgi:CRISPR-associated exonuclease Cas4
MDQNPTPSMVKDMVYCPVIAWIRLKYNVAEPPTDSMKAGRNVKVEKGKGQVLAARNGHRTLIDEVVRERNGVKIIERKAFKARSIDRYLAQLKTSLYIAAHSIGRVRKAELVVGEKKLEIQVTGEILEEGGKLLEKASRLSASDKPPPTRPEPSKCKWCWYSRFCPYS